MEIILEKPVQVEDGDLDVFLSAAFIIKSPLGSLVALRTELRRLFGENKVYQTIASSPLFVVHWNDLSEKKQEELTAKRSKP